MQETVITWATPVFLALIAFEFAWGWRRGRNTYRLNDAITSIGLGALSQVAGVFTRVLRLGIYVLAYELLALARWPAEAWWALPAALLFYDFCYYWHHRWMHEVAIAWAAHVVHHSSEDYNLSTALRQTATGELLGWIPYLPMAIAGVPPSLFITVALIDLLYQFWIHTGHVGRLGWFDRVFASPSNHRVHHAVNDRYLDRNYGGILIVWDRLFGSFQEELDDDPPVYGTRKPLRSFDPLRANFEVYAQLAGDSLRTRRWRDKLQLWVRRPGWLPADLAAAADAAAADAAGARTAAGAPAAARDRFDPAVPAAVRLHAGFQFAVLLGCSVYFLQLAASASTAVLLAWFAFIALSMSVIGALLEGREVAARMELARAIAILALVAAGASWPGPGALPAGIALALGALAAASVLSALRAARALASMTAAPSAASAGTPR